ncbi:MAG: ABC transporter permease [Armatimonadetes bacterium]|nr:ABC transporter permease [Armatimonadota bacterium]
MILKSLPFLFHEAWLNIRRQALMTVASVSTVAVSLSILGIFLFLAWQLHAWTAELPNQFEIHAFLRMTTSRATAASLTEQFRQMSGVREARLVTREEAWDAWRRQQQNRTDLYGEENPLPDKIVVKAENGARTLALADAIRNLPGVERVNAGEEVIRRLISVASIVRTAGLILAGLLALGTAAIISNAIRLTLFARRREIRIMQLVGATNGFIRFPFILEGIVAGVLGATIACSLLYLAVIYLQERVRLNLTLFTPLHIRVDLPLFFAALAALGLVTGLLGSMISLRRFLRA